MDDAILKLNLPLKAEGPDAAVVLGQGRAVGHADGQVGVGGEHSLVRVDEAIEQPVGVGIAPHQALDIIGHRVGVGAVVGDAPAQLHAPVDVQQAALARLLLKGRIDVPAVRFLCGVGAVLVGYGEVGIGQPAGGEPVHVKLRALVRLCGEDLSHVGQAVLLQGHVGGQSLHLVGRPRRDGAQPRRQQQGREKSGQGLHHFILGMSALSSRASR